ncbi:MAG: chromate transporter, partial [Synergistaceae bacterium]|nr:chromate transporter [Synergistaceae bacterium]
AGLPGSVIATLGLITPSVIVILIVYAFLHAFKDNRYVNAVFYGLRPASAAMITAAGLIVSRITFIPDAINIKAVILACVLLILTHGIKFTKKLHPVIWIFVSAFVGIIFSF